MINKYHDFYIYIKMGYWKRSLRGNNFEDLINLTNEVYRRKKLAIIQKISTPITPVKFDKDNKYITLAYFDKKSTVDYIGVVQGIPICFDVKETSLKNLPIQNIHEHQIDFMDNFVEQGGISFILVYFSLYKEYYLITFDVLKEYWKNSKNGKGRKSIPYGDLKKDMIVPLEGIYINYLKTLQKKLSD